MKQAFDLSSVILALRKGVEAGHWTVEDLDRAPSGRSPNLGPPRNLLRDAVQPHPEAVQVISDRDLPPMPQGVTPAERQDLPLTIDDDNPF